MTIAGLVQLQAGTSPEAEAILAPGRGPMIYGQLADFISDTGRRLNSPGVGRGDRVAVVLLNGPEMALAFRAVPSMTVRP